MDRGKWEQKPHNLVRGSLNRPVLAPRPKHDVPSHVVSAPKPKRAHAVGAVP